jgi:hypothetical protein
MPKIRKIFTSIRDHHPTHRFATVRIARLGRQSSMISSISAAEDYRAKARRLREIAERRETAPSVREALAMAADEYEKLAEGAARGEPPPH